MAYRVCWLSAGVSSFVAAYLARSVDEIIYIDIEDQHPDSMRFVNDCEKVLRRKITVLKSPYGNVDAACRAFGYISGVRGAKCTEVLKRRTRKEWEYAHRDCSLVYVWGFDCTEQARADRLDLSMPHAKHEFPLIDHAMTKVDAHGFMRRMGIKRPVMYDLGYSNNNCIGCVKGGKGYWNKIRVDFPDVFAKRAKLERDIGASCINGCYLDELPVDAGRMQDEIMNDCGIICEIEFMQAGINVPALSWEE